MNAADLDRLLHQLSASSPEAPDRIVEGVLSRLGPPAAQVRTAYLAGLASCALGIALAFWIGLTSHPEPEIAPPAFTLLTQGAGPLAAL